ncbi:hypothetical protein D1007_21304 [Hordeum vulgare]|nr:hypothetical protein D1007_21304 [Hordeum vulgare]
MQNRQNMNLDTIQENEEKDNMFDNSEEMQSEEESEEVDNTLLIDFMAAEAEKKEEQDKEKEINEEISYEKTVINSMQIVPSPMVNRKFSSYLDACVGERTVTELEDHEKSGEEKDQCYFVQSPAKSSELVDVIPTPPVIEEVQVRFSKRTTSVNMEHMGDKAEKMAKKGTYKRENLLHLTHPGEKKEK